MLYTLLGAALLGFIVSLIVMAFTPQHWPFRLRVTLTAGLAVGAMLVDIGLRLS